MGNDIGIYQIEKLYPGFDDSDETYKVLQTTLEKATDIAVEVSKDISLRGSRLTLWEDEVVKKVWYFSNGKEDTE